MNRKLPRPFEFPWGKGQVVEEVSVLRPHWEPTIQLLRYEDGEESLRFCYYHGPRFGRGPMMASIHDLKELKAQAQHTAPTTRTPPNSLPIKRIVNGQDVLVEMR